MDTARTAPTPQQARDRLQAARARPLVSVSDRRVHAVGTAVVGASVAVAFTSQTLFSGIAGVAATALFVAVIFLEGRWVERAARTVPRRSRLISRTGIGASFVLALVAVLPWLNLSAQTAPVTWSMVLAGAAVAAAPSLVAAAVIAGRRG